MSSQTDDIQPGGQTRAFNPTGEVDVIIAAWNRADTIERAIRSVADEPAVRSVIVVDDASTDKTADHALALAGGLPKLKVIVKSQNAGPSAARNAALAVSDAPWIAILDGDDYMQPGRLTRLLALSAHADFVADDLLQIDEAAPPGTTPHPLLNIDSTWPSEIGLIDFVRGNISIRGRLRREMGFLKPIMRRAFLQDHGLHYDEAVRLGEDYLLYAGALATGARFRLVPAAGYVAVMRSTSLSGRHSRQDLEALLRGGQRLAALPKLQPEERHALEQHCRHIDGKIRWLVVIEAVKARDLMRFLGAFKAPPEIGLELAGKLAEQLRLRGMERLRRLWGSSHGR
jgi:succinoglycan biosynthesis protein ExoU